MECIPRKQVIEEKRDWIPTLEGSRVDRIATSQAQIEMKQKQDDDNQEKPISCNEEEAKIKEDMGMNIAMNEVVTQIDTSYDQKADDTL